MLRPQEGTLRVLVTGATGYIGKRLIQTLSHPVILSRDPKRAKKIFPNNVDIHRWDSLHEPAPKEAFGGVQAIIHLLGENVGAKRWTQKQKAKIYDSRVMGTRHLIETLGKLSSRPPLLISASAVGIYGDGRDEILDIQSPVGSDFLAQVCQAWEAESQKATALGVRVINPRIGVVFGPGGGVLTKILTPFKLGLGGKLGSGAQWMPWIHREDLVRLFQHLLANAEIQGPLNAVAPVPVTNAEFTKTLAKLLKRPAFFHAPSFALKTALGEQSSLLLTSQRAVPALAQQAGFEFRFPNVQDALKEILFSKEKKS